MVTPFIENTEFTPEVLVALRAQVQGEVIVPGDARYDDARQAWNLAVEQRPALIVIVANASDVAASVRFARAQGLGISVQSTGHGVVQPANDNLLIITSRLTEVRVDAETQTAWVEAGALWGMVLEKTQAVGLAPLLGSSPGVGVVGYTLGGGLGWLARKYGLAADSVRAFELVTADGNLRRASADQNSDLFWALRGGGGNFGIVTGMEIQLYPVSTVFAGNLIYPVSLAKTIFARYRDWIASAPEELTSSIVIMNFPPIPAVPEFLRGQTAVIIRGCYTGPVKEGQALLQSWLDWQAPIANLWHAMPFSEAGTISNDPKDPSPGVSSGAWLRDLSDETIDALIQYGVSVNGSSPLVVTEVRHVSGAMARVDKHASAFGNRDASLLLSLIGMAPTPEAAQAVRQHIGQLKTALQPHLTGGVYMNFLEGQEARERTPDAYLPENYRRLMAIKAQYDPDNFFRFSFDIPPVKNAPDGE
jgi:FAD/FMN-containing dehydrogenase